MRKIFTCFILFSFWANLYAQVPQKVVVEHFTNSKCGICASRNPGFFTNLKANPDVLHLAVYPSAPYKDCALNKHNVAENDARTKYYGVYGGTPRLVIQGIPLPASTDYTKADIFTSHSGMVSPASIQIEQKKYALDSITVTVVVKTEASHTLGSLQLFVALTEDTVFYQGSNGEPEHYDVFRKALTPAEGKSLTLPANVGDSIIFSASSAVHADWNFDRIYAFVTLQETASKDLVQAERSSPKDGLISGIKTCEELAKTQIFPNPVRDKLFISCPGQTQVQLKLYDLTGREVLSKNFNAAIHIDMNELPKGQYILQLTNGPQQNIKKILKL